MNHSFFCPVCSGVFFGRFTPPDAPPMSFGYVRCHDEFGLNCDWSGPWEARHTVANEPLRKMLLANRSRITKLYTQLAELSVEYTKLEIQTTPRLVDPTNLPDTNIVMVWLKPQEGCMRSWQTVFYDDDDQSVSAEEWFGNIHELCAYWLPMPPPPKTHDTASSDNL